MEKTLKCCVRWKTQGREKKNLSRQWLEGPSHHRERGGGAAGKLCVPPHTHTHIRAVHSTPQHPKNNYAQAKQNVPQAQDLDKVLQ